MLLLYLRRMLALIVLCGVFALSAVGEYMQGVHIYHKVGQVRTVFCPYYTGRV